MTTADSAHIRLGLVQAIVDTVGRGAPPARIWVEWLREREPATGETRRFALPANEWAAIADAYPQAMQVEQANSLFDCPPGVTVRMPGSGCPMRDGGIIISFGPIQIAGDSVRAGAVLTQSSARGTRVSTWAQGLTLAFRRVNGIWRRRVIRFLWIT